jgi:hypothetical protein
MANFFHTLVLPDEVKCSSPMTSAPILTTFSRRVVAHARSTVFQMAGGAVSRDLFGRISGDDRRVAAKAGRAKLTLAGRITKGQLTGELRLPCG